MSVRTLFVCLFMAIPLLAAQSNMSRHEGRLITNGSADTLWVELYGHASHMLVDRVPVCRDGTFIVTAAYSLGAHQNLTTCAPIELPTPGTESAPTNH